MTRRRSTSKSFFLYCPRCSTELEPFLDEENERRRCPQCNFIHYRNPNVGVAAVLWERDVVELLGEERTREGLLDKTWKPAHPDSPPRVLLARRALTFRGQWCFPCGFVEYDETIREAAVREGLEETGLRLEIGPVCAAHSNFHLPDEQSVGIWFHARPVAGPFRPGDDVDGLGFFDLDTVGDTVSLAFPNDRVVLNDLRRRGVAPRAIWGGTET